jgi:hypothetical protein
MTDQLHESKQQVIMGKQHTIRAEMGYGWTYRTGSRWRTTP